MLHDIWHTNIVLLSCNNNEISILNIRQLSDSCTLFQVALGIHTQGEQDKRLVQNFGGGGVVHCNIAKYTVKLYWLCSNGRQIGMHVCVCVFVCSQGDFKVQGTWNQYSSWQRTFNAELFACWLIGHEGQLFEHPSWASVSSREPSCGQDKLQPIGLA